MKVVVTITAHITGTAEIELKSGATLADVAGFHTKYGNTFVRYKDGSEQTFYTDIDYDLDTIDQKYPAHESLGYVNENGEHIGVIDNG